MSHFSFLEREWPAVFEAAGKAEAAVHPDPRTACATTCVVPARCARRYRGYLQASFGSSMGLDGWMETLPSA